MRLVCPNCGAQYEVDDRVMPENGRDVQCSACGHAWFQRGPATPGVENTEPEAHPTSDTSETPAESATPSDTVEEPPTDTDAPSDTPSAAPAASLPQREMDPGVKSILQEEAQRELDARQTEQEQLETQTEMGLEDVDPDEAQRQSIRERMARLRGADDEFEATEALPQGRGKDLLPDIEEINSTLDASHSDLSKDEAIAETEEAPSSGGGFRRGFLMVVVLALLLLALYAYAPAIADMIPGVKAPLDQYVTFVDQLRVSLNTAMENAINAMQGASGDAN
ncbi:zinc-ribbon domain-containing protein [Aliiroseovarius crassostreae]|uniref:zinc-ribbon domain-containing protein n=1 Tax=Aliiroseovarius crassostreae TaxID=154981 RepID=UPI003C7D1263